ncbi:O-antigen/teichoic acid export membrane protein [Paraburkholderia bannensis]|uniref:O-antigen/teichoic acid export membrane protein n=1 Tax=Paraburkholderia bannensis TaxID=765414 RepID=A0A7W9WUB5_9BURK|nr:MULTISPECIES: oligosaccharide flippase family protein [Paraburkholderia]MBB3259187.1 O-antigen/teichoic acid export membrane protein [Paraburkholderia sp. WP4_3_2]MBB6104202.1 O-antigen/teichoic acid export membrane protein [Paraburkholderia bannensis]
MSDIQTAPASSGASIVRGSLISLGVRLMDLPSRYGFHLLVAAALGVTQAGNFYIVFSTMVALAGFGRLSIDQALTRQIAMDMASGRAHAVRPAIRRALTLIVLASVAVSVLLAASSALLAQHVLKKPDLAWPLVLGSLVFVPQNVGGAFAGALAGLQRVGLSQMIYSWLWPAIFCVVAIPLQLLGVLNVAHALMLIAASFALTALVGAVLLKRALAVVPAGSVSASDAAHLVKPGLSLFALEFTKLLITSAPAIVLGIVATSRETGLFSLAWRLALVVNLLISGVTGMAAPRFASLYARHDIEGLQRSAAQAVGIVLCLALPFTACMLVFPERLLALFGAGYGAGASALRVLALGQLAAACFTAMPELLGMTAHTSVLYRINIYSVAVLLIGLAVLAPLGGGVGAAAAASLALAVNGAIAAWAAHRLLGVAPLAALWRKLSARLKPAINP